jgi:zinc transporter ZupT
VPFLFLRLQALNLCVTKLVRGNHSHSHIHHDHAPAQLPTTQSVSQLSSSNQAAQTSSTPTPVATTATPAVGGQPACFCCSDDPATDLEAIKSMAEELQQREDVKVPAMRNDSRQGNDLLEENADGANSDEAPIVEPSVESSDDDDQNAEGNDRADARRKEDEAKLMRMSINTAIAIGLHNFPEGLATFVAALHDPRVGAVLAVAIAIHNIPEGLCVALPVYYATGNRWKAFGLACASGASEPIAALLGWAVLANSFSDTMYAVLFGLVAGMMVIISVRELLPTAHRYDPDDCVVTYSFIAGMCIMALSLVLFAL